MDEYGRKSAEESRRLSELYDKYSHLRVAFEKADNSKVPLDKQKKQVESPYILNNIRKHRLVPALTPSKSWRRIPDRRAFLAREAQDRKDAINYQLSRERPKFRDKSKFNNVAKDQGFEV